MTIDGAGPLIHRVLRGVDVDGPSADPVLRSAGEELGGFLQAWSGRAYLCAGTGEVLVPLIEWIHHPEFRASAPEPHAPVLGPGEGLPGRAWVARRPIWNSDLSREGERGDDPRPDLPGSGAAVAIPLLAGRGAAGVLEFFFTEPRDPDERLLEEIIPVSRILGEALGRIRAEEELASARGGFGSLPGQNAEGVMVPDLQARLRSWSRIVSRPADHASGESPDQMSLFTGVRPAVIPEKAPDDGVRRGDRDALTGVANRNLFTKGLLRAIERVHRNPEVRFAVLFLDLDNFKDVNDSHGHVLGDDLLVAVAQRLEEAVRPGDILARYGGDEFVILLDYFGNVNDVLAVAERISERLLRPFEIDGLDLRLSASIGIALSDTGYDRVDQILRDADSAMYRAKEEGGGRFRLFDRDLREEALTQGRIRSELEFSLDRGEFRLHYQPLVNLASNRITGLEALLRWQHPVRGLVTATEFITEAEEMRLILPIGRWVIREGCRQLRTWQERFRAPIPLVLSLNLSARELLEPRLRDWLQESMEESGVAASSLQMEVPEAFFGRPKSEVEGALRPLQELGVQIGIDEFGGGNFSLGHLGHSPVDFLKIDRRFVADILKHNGEDERTVRAILALAESLGLQVVAPGVETSLQEELLRKLACPIAQGYFISAPVDAEQVDLILQRGMVRRDDG